MLTYFSNVYIDHLRAGLECIFLYITLRLLPLPVLLLSLCFSLAVLLLPAYNYLIQSLASRNLLHSQICSQLLFSLLVV